LLGGGRIEGWEKGKWVEVKKGVFVFSNEYFNFFFNFDIFLTSITCLSFFFLSSNRRRYNNISAIGPRQLFTEFRRFFSILHQFWWGVAFGQNTKFTLNKLECFKQAAFTALNTISMG